MSADLRIIANTKRLVEATVKAYGKIDILVNACGILKYALLEDKNFTAVFNDVTATNEVGNTQVTRHAAPYLKQTNGTVVFIASIAAKTPVGPQLIILKNYQAYHFLGSDSKSLWYDEGSARPFDQNLGL